MARSITASVGRAGGRNLPADVRTVQELLNRVPPGSGGPVPPLAVDSLIGPKTIGAIQKFQLHHFGFGGADGRVDPQGRTLRMLNEFDRPGQPLPRPPVPPSPIPPTPVPLPAKAGALTTASIMRCPHGGPIQGVPSAARPAASGLLLLHAEDSFLVAGCPFMMPGPVTPIPSPCIRVQWVQPPVGPLSASSIGICFGTLGVPQGNVIVVSA